MRLPILAAFLLSACATSTQLSSGAAYLAAGPAITDKDIARAAAVEPDLHFPARIGVARVLNGDLTLPSAAEAALFADWPQAADYGTFVPISPLIMTMVTGQPSKPIARERGYTVRDTGQVVQDIRLAAARQHLDYVLIYEIGARSSQRDTPFALADVTLIGGAFLPTRSIKAMGIGQALLVDVRNGYPYGTTQVSTDLSGVARSFGTHRREAFLQDKATLKVSELLIPEVFKMLADLKAQTGG